MLNLPNTLTVLRIVLTFAFIFFLFMNGLSAKVFAFITFLVASVTDFLDGFIAKKRNQITDFGKLMDPLADKILVLSAFIAFVEIGVIQAWMVIVIIFREVAITTLRALALTKGKVIQADISGKHKTVFQVISIFIILLYLIFNEGGSAIFSFWSEGVSGVYRSVIHLFMFITVILTLASGVVYLIKNKGVYSHEKTN